MENIDNHLFAVRSVGTLDSRESSQVCERSRKVLPIGSSMLPSVTVITVVLNGGLILEDTICSVINQTYQNVEYLVIDGGSTDNTTQIIKKYHDDIDCWVSEPDEGIFDAMNKGVGLATGEYIIFMNAGDRFFNNDTVQNVFSNLPFGGADLLYGDCQVEYSRHKRTIAAGDLDSLWKGMVFSHQSLFVRRTLLCAYPFDIDHPLSADFDFIWKMRATNKTFHYHPDIISTVTAMGISDLDRISVLLSHYAVVSFYDKRWVVKLYYSLRMTSETLKKVIKFFLRK